MLSDNLVLLRTMKGYSQEEIAEKIGISRQAYAKWEKGDTVPDVDRCNKLATIYSTTIDSLLNAEGYGGDIIMPPTPKGKYIWGTVTISERGQIVIPKSAREHFDLKAGDKMVVLGSDGDGIALAPAEIFEKNLEYLMTKGKERGDA